MEKYSTLSPAPHMESPLAVLHADGRLTISAPFAPLLISRLRAIPATNREYDPALRRWTISRNWGEKALDAFRAAFPDGYVVALQGAS